MKRKCTWNVSVIQFPFCRSCPWTQSRQLRASYPGWSGSHTEFFAHVYMRLQYLDDFLFLYLLLVFCYNGMCKSVGEDGRVAPGVSAARELPQCDAGLNRSTSRFKSNAFVVEPSPLPTTPLP